MSKIIKVTAIMVSFLLICGASAVTVLAEGESNLVTKVGYRTWQKDPSSKPYRWKNAIEYCSSLELAGYSDWRMPNIDELRSIVRGCPDSETGGSCGVTEDCASVECAVKGSCFVPCPDKRGKGPGQDGCLWEPSLQGKCDQYWTSSTFLESFPSGSSETITDAWTINFVSGRIDAEQAIENFRRRELYVRCVR